MLGELFIKYNKKGITKDCAKYLYVGILTDTNRFFYPSTTSNTLKIASELIATGFDREVLHHKLYLNPLKNIKFNHFLFSKAKFICDNKIGYIVLDKNDFKKNDVSEKTPIIHVLGNVEELKV
jgi:phosphoesterase RecJ-like protein